MAKVNFLKVNSTILDDLISLSVSEGQNHLIAANAEWLAQANFNEIELIYQLK